ncbi:MAG: LamG domain-containing protein [Treponemataceae bacterium]|nr:LamG domain-containing protein [Treponemataceae bacterium]
MKKSSRGHMPGVSRIVLTRTILLVGIGMIMAGCGMPTIGRSSGNTTQEAPETTSALNLTNSTAVAVYQFEENLNDESGNNNTATATGSTSYVIGYRNKSLNLSNASNVLNAAYITLPDNLVGKTFTISYWAKVGTWNTTWGALAHMIFKTSSGTWEGFVSHGANSDTSFYARNRSDLASDWGDIFATLPTAGQWFHVTETMDTSGVATLYINGTAVGNYNTAYENFTAAQVSIMFGQDTWQAQGVVLDDVVIYDRALSASEVTQLYNGTLP